MGKLKLHVNTWLLVAPILVTIIVALFGYRDTLAEADMVRMVTGIVYGGATGARIFAGHHYGIEFSFGYYELLYRLIPESSLTDPDYVARSVNNLGIAFAFLVALSLGLMLDKFVSRGVAAFSAIGFLFCPVVLSFLASGHPMIGACAFLFLGCWLILVSSKKINAGPVAINLAFAFVALTASLCLRGEIALAFPFVAVAYLVSEKRQAYPSLLRGIAVCLVMTLAFVCFLYFQRPFVASEGGAINSLVGFLSAFASIGRIVRGVVVLMLGLGIITALLLALAVLSTWLRPKDSKVNLLLVLACLTLIIPSLIFWLPNPQPARHFVIPILGLYMLLGQLGASRLIEVKRAILMAVFMALGNQAFAELVRPLIVNNYQWSYNAMGLRRSTQQVPLGFFPLDQRANIAMAAAFRREALQLAAAKPQMLLILADNQDYIIARLLADDPGLRLVSNKVGNFKVLLLTSAHKKIYMIEERYPFWPRDVISEILDVSAFSEYPIHVQKATMSPYDKAQVPESRKYRID